MVDCPLWSAAAVHYLLTNVVYVGRVAWGGMEGRGRHEALVPPVLFDRVAARLRDQCRRRRLRPAPPPELPVDEPLRGRDAQGQG